MRHPKKRIRTNEKNATPRKSTGKSTFWVPFPIFLCFFHGFARKLEYDTKKSKCDRPKMDTGVMISKCDRGACVAFGVAPQYSKSQNSKVWIEALRDFLPGQEFIYLIFFRREISRSVLGFFYFIYSGWRRYSVGFWWKGSFCFRFTCRSWW